MRKKIVLLLSFVCAFALAFGVFIAGCSKDKDDDVANGDVIVTISKTELNLTTGATSTLTATASDGSEIVWTTSNEAVASVNNGKVKGESAGTATITATVKDGTANATCAVTVKDPVTFTFKNADGDTITDLEVDRNGDPVQISATASDGSTINVWSVLDATIASVENGLVTGLKEGTTSVVVGTSTGTGEIEVNVIDTAEHEAITEDTAQPGHWWYYLNKQDRSPEVITNEVREGVLTFEFGGNCNWTLGDVRLGLKKDATAKLGWTVLNISINSSVEGTMYIFSTACDLKIGDNTFSVMYDQSEYAEMVYLRPANNITEGKFVIEIADLEWKDYEVITLDAPSFTLDGDTVTITDPNTAGVKEYTIGFFQDEKNVGSQTIKTTTGTIDSTAMAKGTYTLKVKAVGLSGFNSSDWSTDSVEYTVSNEHVQYTLEDAYLNDDAVSSTRWYYIAVTPDWGIINNATYLDGVVTFDINNPGWKYDSVQLFRNYSQFDEGTPVKFTIKVTSTVEGHITISGTVVELKNGENEYTIFTTQGTGATVTILFGDATHDQQGSVDITASVFKFEVTEIADYTPAPLETPSAEYDADEKTVTVTDEKNEKENVSKYEVGFFDDDDKMLGTATLEADGTFSDLAIKDGTYTLKIRAVPKTAEYTNSAWSEFYNGYVVENGGVISDMPFGGDADATNATTNPGTWYYWNDQDYWVGAKTVMNSAKYNEANGGIVTLSYSVTGGEHEGGVRVFYKNPDLTKGNTYALSLTIKTDIAVNVIINGVTKSLEAGENNVTVYYDEETGIGYSVELWIAVNTDNANNTVTIYNAQWTPYTYLTLSAPEIAVDDEGIVTITDPNTEGVASYVAGFFADGSDTPITVNVVNGEAINLEQVGNGSYTLKIQAIGVNGYGASEWSTGISYVVAKESNSVNLVNTLDGAAPAEGWYYYATTVAESWNSWCAVNVTKAVYDLDTKIATFDFTSSGTNDWSFQIVYKFPSGTSSVKVRIQTDFDCELQSVRNVANKTAVTANTPVEIEFSGSEAYMQIPLSNNLGGTVTVTVVEG